MNSEEQWYNLHRHPEHYMMTKDGRIIQRYVTLKEQPVDADILAAIEEEGYEVEA